MKPVQQKADAEAENGGSKGTELAVSTAVGVTGGIMLLFPRTQVAGAVLQGSAAIMGAVAGAAVNRARMLWDDIRTRRLDAFGDIVYARLADEGLKDQLGDIEDLIAEAIPIVADAHTEAKRRLLEEIIVNAVRCEDLAERAEASLALRIIKEMTTEALLAFGNIAQGLKPGTPSDSTYNFQVGSNYLGLEWPMVEAAVVSLADSGLIAGGQKAPPFDLATIRARGFVEFRLSHRAVLLAKWIKKNPPPAG